jgi:HprK-related kinase B
MIDSALSIRIIFDELNTRHQPVHAIDLRFGSCTIRLKSNSRRVVEGLTVYYRSYLSSFEQPDVSIAAIDAAPPELPLKYALKTPDPGKSRIKEEYAELKDGRIVRKRLTGMLFAFGYGINIAVGRCTENINQVVNFVNNRYIQWLLDRGCLLGHAAGVAHGERGLALAGFSGSGKSTLALHLMAHDLSFVSNDRLLIQREAGYLIMYGIPKQPRINPGTALNNDSLESVIPEHDLAAFEELPTDELWELEQKYDVLIEDVYGSDRLRLQSRMGSLVILNWKRDRAVARIDRVDLSSRRDLLAAFMKETGLFYQPDPSHGNPDFSEGAYLDLLRLCNVYEITGGIDFEFAAQACLDLLASE